MALNCQRQEVKGMRLVNPMGRTAETLETGANYNVLSGCVCSDTTALANAHYQGPGVCVGYCKYGTANRNANMEATKKM